MEAVAQAALRTHRAHMAEPTVREVAGNPDWLPHTYDGAGESLTLVHVPRQAREELTFLTAKHFAERFPKASFPAASLAAELNGSARAPLHFIFHTAFCGSTLLAKALTIPGVAEALREPDVLVNLANRLVRSDDAANRARLELVLKLLERPPAPDEAVILKWTNFANRLIEPVLAMRPSARAVLMYSDVQTLLRSLLKRGLWGRRHGRQLYLQLSSWVGISFGLDPAETFELTDMQVAALAWLMQIAHFDAVARAYGPERVMLLETPQFTDSPATALRDVLSFFGLDSSKADEIAAGPVFSRHSKFRVGYGREEREMDHAAIDQAHGEELGMVVQWTSAVAEQLGLPLKPRLTAR
jgi:hypothetical protein